MTEQQQNEPENNPNLEIIDSAPADRQPRPDVACADCIWFRSELELSCFCKAMHAVTWGSMAKSSEILSCGGRA